MNETNWCVITGGPCAGKTKLIEHLSFLGYFIVPEAARIMIDNEISKGKTVNQIRKDERKFQEIILDMKIDVENRIPVEQLTFFERGIPDSIAYYNFYGVDPNPVIVASKKRKYKKIFLLDPLPFEQDYARTEDREFAKKMTKMLRDSYELLGYEVVSVPPLTIEERANFILENIKN